LAAGTYKATGTDKDAYGDEVDPGVVEV
jgi:hypothetical protein